MFSSRSATVLLCVAALLFGAANFTTAAQRKGDAKTMAPPPQQTPFSDVRRDSLLNGLQIVTYETTAERVKIDLIVRSGSMFDLEGKAGLGLLTQSTLLAVNPRLKEEIESLRGAVSWGVNSDATWYRIEVPQASFDTAIEILSRGVIAESIRPEAFKRAQAEHLARAAAMTQSEAEQADAAFLTALYREHPYGRRVEGNEKTLAAIVQGDIYDFERRFYVANNSVAVIVGPITHERVLRSFKSLFGAWNKGAIVPATFRPPQRTTEVRVDKIEVPKATRVELRGGFIGVKVTDPDFLVAAVLAKVIEARLKKDPAIQSTDRISADAPMRFLPGPVFFSASIAPERALAFSRSATDSFAALASDLVSTEDLIAAKAGLAAERSAMSIGEQLRELEYYSLPRNYPLTFAGRLDAITAADVHRVARRLLAANALTLVVLGPVGDTFKPSTEN